MVAKIDTPLVLVADDEINTTIMLQHIFEREGYRVEKVNNGIAALEMAKTLHPDLILLDILMPGMNGFEVLRQLREDEATKEIPTILITANARQPADVARGLTLGADDYIYKPFAHQELVARAESKIHARRLKEALERRTQELSALLDVSESLNQHYEDDDLLDEILVLLNRLLPNDITLIIRVNELGEITQKNAQNNVDGISLDTDLLGELAEKILYLSHPVLSPPDPLPMDIPGVQSALVASLKHSNHTVGALALISFSSIYDEDQLRLFTGITRQAALAMRNAQLYAIQLNYATHLGDMVDAKTDELKSAQQMLIRSEKLASIGHMAASLAHEINTPLMPIKLGLEDFMAQLDELNVPVDREGVDIIQESIDRIQRIIRRLLDFARNTDPDSQELDVSHILDGIIKLNHKFFEHSRIAIQSDLASLPSIYGSKDQLEQVFMNLTLNAQAAMPDGGTLWIKSAELNDEIIIEFKDTGSGIPQENLSKIFDPFFSTKPNGTGLGLFVSYGIIQAHHGNIEVYSVLDEGTHFIIHIPKHKRDVLTF